MKKPIQFIAVSILIVLTVISVTNYFIKNPISPTCENIEIFSKIMFPVIFTGLLFLALRTIGKGLHGEIKTKMVYLIGFFIFLFTNAVMYLAGKVDLTNTCNSFDLCDYVSVFANLIIFPVFSAMIGNYFEKLRIKSASKNPKQGAHA